MILWHFDGPYLRALTVGNNHRWDISRDNRFLPLGSRCSCSHMMTSFQSVVILEKKNCWHGWLFLRAKDFNQFLFCQLTSSSMFEINFTSPGRSSTFKNIRDCWHNCSDYSTTSTDNQMYTVTSVHLLAKHETNRMKSSIEGGILWLLIVETKVWVLAASDVALIWWL